MTILLKTLHTNLVQEMIHQIKFLPAYSPQLNPIEECFAQWKGYIKLCEKSTVDDVLELIDICADKITAQNCEHYYNHCVRFYVECAAGKPLRGDGNAEKREINKRKKLQHANTTHTSCTISHPNNNLIDEDSIERKYDDEEEIDHDLTSSTNSACNHRSLSCTCTHDDTID